MGYTTVDAVKASYGANPPADADIEASIALWSAFVDRETRQWFEEREGTYYFDGDGTNVIFLPIPIIEVTALYTAGDFDNPLDTTSYIVYNSRTVPDDRRNPKIVLIGQRSVIYPYVQDPPPRMPVGRADIKVVGSFGFLEPDDTCPLLIEKATRMLVVNELKQAAGLAGSTPLLPSGPVTGYTVDRNSVSFASTSTGGTKAGKSALTGNVAIDTILAMYRAPVLIGVSGTLEIK